MQDKVSKESAIMRSGGTAVAEQLHALGAKTIFTVPGETFISALDGFYDLPSLRVVTCRHEGGAAMMAEASAKVTGKPGVLFVTRAPGLANAISGLVVARHDQTPLLLLVGLPKTSLEDRGDLQSGEFNRLMGAVAKSTMMVRNPERIPEALARAYHLTTTGRPGAVVVGFPEDVLNSPCKAKAVKRFAMVRSRSSKSSVKAIEDALKTAEAPLILVGGGPWSRKAQSRVQAFAERLDIPIAAAFRCQDFIDNRHPCYVGHAGIAINAKLASAIRGADVLLVVGANLGDVTTGHYTLIKAPQPKQKLIQVQAHDSSLTQAIRADVAIDCPADRFCTHLDKIQEPKKIKWAAWRHDLRKAYELSCKPKTTPGDVKLESIVCQLSEMLDDTAIITNGAGNYAQFVHRYFTYKGYRTCLAPAAGSMGYGVPAAIAAKIAKPKRQVVAFAGDGCLMMTVQELATAVQYDAPIMIIVANNGMLGTIRMHQDQRFPDRVIATTLANPNFADLAKSFGAFGAQVHTTDAFADTFRQAQSSGKPALIELLLDPEAITPDETRCFHV